MKNLLVILLLSVCYREPQAVDKLIFSDNFSKPIDRSRWIAEIEEKPGSLSTVQTQNGALVLNTKGGVTVWFNELLSGNIRIEFDRKILVDTGSNDRLSDCNTFWMAQPSPGGSVFGRNGKFESYDDLQLYYVGMGGNTNSTTRFRKYGIDGKPVIKEWLDSAHLLKANQSYHISIVVDKGKIAYWVNNDCYFNYTDPAPLKSGYFGFRSTWSRQEIRNFKVYRIE